MEGEVAGLVANRHVGVSALHLAQSVTGSPSEFMNRHINGRLVRSSGCADVKHFFRNKIVARHKVTLEVLIFDSLVWLLVYWFDAIRKLSIRLQSGVNS